MILVDTEHPPRVACRCARPRGGSPRVDRAAITRVAATPSRRRGTRAGPDWGDRPREDVVPQLDPLRLVHGERDLDVVPLGEVDERQRGPVGQDDGALALRCGRRVDVARTVADKASVLKFTRAGMENA